MTVPFIHGWTLQWYATVPAVVNVKVNVSPGFIAGLVNRGLANPSLVVANIWSGRYPPASMVLSLFVQVTVLFTPMTTVTASGENPRDDWEVPAPFTMPI
jgi:hypothetical protein